MPELQLKALMCAAAISGILGAGVRDGNFDDLQLVVEQFLKTLFPQYAIDPEFPQLAIEGLASFLFVSKHARFDVKSSLVN